METLETLLLIVLSINLVMVLTQFSAQAVNPDFTESLINCAGSPLGQYGNCTTKGVYTFNASNPNLPTSSSSTDVTSGGIFTDLYNTIKGFFSDTLGLKYVVAIFSAPTTFLKNINVDPTFAGLIGAMWWIFTLGVVVTYLKR
jgi:hypothetical protein